MTSRSRQNASIRPSSSRQNDTSSSAFGWSVVMASRVPRTSSPSSSGVGSPGRQSAQISREMRTISARTAAYSRSARSRTSDAVIDGSRSVWRSFDVNSGSPSSALPVVRTATSVPRCSPIPSSSDAARSAASRSLGRSAATSGSVGAAASACATASRASPATPPIRLPAISACRVDTGRSGFDPTTALAWSSSAGTPSSREQADVSRTASGAKSRASSGCRPLPIR